LAGVGTAVGREILDEAIDQGVSYVTDGKVDGLPTSAADIAEGLAKRAIRNGIKNACEAGADDAIRLGLKAKGAGVAPTSVRPSATSSLPGRVTQELPAGGMRDPGEVKQARNFFERNREAARKWWEQRTGQRWPEDAVHDSHPRALKDGGDPLLIEPSYETPWGPHIGPGDFSRWGKEGGFWKHKKNQ
jgi:hypothetical protein